MMETVICQFCGDKVTLHPDAVDSWRTSNKELRRRSDRPLEVDEVAICGKVECLEKWRNKLDEQQSKWSKQFKAASKKARNGTMRFN
jgi:hypothetical protein